MYISSHFPLLVFPIISLRKQLYIIQWLLNKQEKRIESGTLIPFSIQIIELWFPGDKVNLYFLVLNDFCGEGWNNY